MTPRTTFWVLFIGLLVLLPVPVFGEQWGLLPGAYLWGQLLLSSVPASLFKLNHLIAAVLASALCWLMSWLYCRLAAAWPEKIRGSIMAITLLSLLIFFASAPIYRDVQRNEAAPLRLQWLYE